jgi:proteasome lid subunit RPN8/RPN11
LSGRGPGRAPGTSRSQEDEPPLDALTPPAGLRIDHALFDRLLAHLVAASPWEGVGLLAVAEDGAGSARATRFYPGTNVDASPTRYTMDPAEVLAAFRDIEARGWRLGAIVHSHPATPPTPSPTDLREAHYPEALLVIVSLAVAPPEARAWRIARVSPPVAAEVPLIVEHDG